MQRSSERYLNIYETCRRDKYKNYNKRPIFHGGFISFLSAEIGAICSKSILKFINSRFCFTCLFGDIFYDAYRKKDEKSLMEIDGFSFYESRFDCRSLPHESFVDERFLGFPDDWVMIENPIHLLTNDFENIFLKIS